MEWTYEDLIEEIRKDEDWQMPTPVKEMLLSDAAWKLLEL